MNAQPHVVEIAQDGEVETALDGEVKVYDGGPRRESLRTALDPKCQQ